MGYRVAILNRASNPVAAENGMPDLDTRVIDLCRRTPRKRKSKTRSLHHMTSMSPNRVPRRTQDKRQTNRPCASEFSHSYEFNSTAHALKLCCGERYTGLSLWPVWEHQPVASYSAGRDIEAKLISEPSTG